MGMMRIVHILCIPKIKYVEGGLSPLYGVSTHVQMKNILVFFLSTKESRCLVESLVDSFAFFDPLPPVRLMVS